MKIQSRWLVLFCSTLSAIVVFGCSGGGGSGKAADDTPGVQCAADTNWATEFACKDGGLSLAGEPDIYYSFYDLANFLAGGNEKMRAALIETPDTQIDLKKAFDLTTCIAHAECQLTLSTDTNEPGTDVKSVNKEISGDTIQQGESGEIGKCIRLSTVEAKAKGCGFQLSEVPPPPPNWKEVFDCPGADNLGEKMKEEQITYYAYTQLYTTLTLKGMEGKDGKPVLTAAEALKIINCVAEFEQDSTYDEKREDCISSKTIFGAAEKCGYAQYMDVDDG